MPQTRRRCILTLLLAMLASLLPVALPAQAQAGEIVVTSNAGGGGGSCPGATCTLHAAISAANARTGTDRVTIRFEMAGGNQIDVSAPIPAIQRANVTLEGRNGAGTNPPRVVLAGSLDNASGLVIQNVGGVIIRDLVVQGFGTSGTSDYAGILISGEAASNNLVENVYAGQIGADGLASAALTPNLNGIWITAGADNNLVSGAVLVGNSFAGLRIDRGSAFGEDPIQGNQVRSSLIGVDPAGNLLPNGTHGISVNDYVQNLLIGGDSEAERNVIVGHSTSGGAGISIASSQAQQGLISIRGNYIGIGADGATAAGNDTGILAQLQVGQLDIRNNLIASNATDGIQIFNVTSSFTHTISGNTLGLSSAATSNLARGNGQNGIHIANSATSDTNGTLIANNIIGGNGENGILLANERVVNTRIEGNIVGLNAAGDAARPNGLEGVLLACTNSTQRTGPSGTFIGANNTISGNTNSGIRIEGGNNTSVSGNRIGLRASGSSGTPAIGNGSNGVTIVNTSACTNQLPNGVLVENNIIGGNGTLTADNQIGVGIEVNGDAVSGTIIRNNLIGLAADQSALAANVQNGISIVGADNTLIEGNTVAGNGTGTDPGTGSSVGGAGIVLRTSSGLPLNTTITGNSVGLAGLGNGGQGIYVIGPFSGASVNINSTIGPANTVVSNGGAGIQLTARVNGVRLSENVVFGNQPTSPLNLLFQGSGTTRANANIQPPTIVRDGGSDTVSGVATNSDGAPCGADECRVEIFGSDGNTVAEAKVFVGAALSGAGGSYSVNVASRGTNRYLRATTTDLRSGQNNTSLLSNFVDAGNSTAVATPVLDVSPQPSQTVPAGGSAVFIHTLTNVGGANGSFQLGFTPSAGLSGANVALDPVGAFALNAGQSRTVTATITAPTDATGGATFSIALRAFEVGNPSNVSQDRTDSLTIQSTRGFEIEPPFDRAGGPVSPGTRADYTYTLTNTGNVSENFEFSFSSNPPGVTVSFVPSGELAQGLPNVPPGPRTFTLGVQVPADFSLPELTSFVTVTLPGVGSQVLTQTTQVDLRPTPTWSPPVVEQVTAPNTPITATLNLSNAGQASGSVTVTDELVAGVPAEWAVSISPSYSNAAFPVGASLPLTVVVTPTNLISGTLLDLRLTASTDADTTASANVRTRVGPVTGFDFGPTPLVSPGIVTPGSTVSYTHIITNNGNFAETFDLSAGLLAGEPSVSVAVEGPSSLTVPAFESRPITVTVTVSDTAVGAFATSRVTATATSGLQPIVERFVEQQTNIQQVPQPRWTPTSDSRLTPPQVPVTYTLTLSNVGLIGGSFTVVASAPPTTSWEFSVSPQSFGDQNLEPDEGQQFTVVVTPTDSQVLSGTLFAVTLTASTPSGPNALATLTTIAAQVPGLAFEAAPQASSAPGQVVSFTNTLTNSGNGSDTFSFANPGPIPGLNSVEVPPPLTLGPQQSATVLVTYTIAAGADAGLYSRTITATSQASPSLEASVVNSVEVLSTPAPQLDTLPAQPGKPGDVVTFTHTLTNVGNIAGSFTITGPATLPPGVAAITITPETLSLGLLESAAVTVVVELASTASAGSITVPITATAGSSSVSVNDSVTVGLVAGVAIGPASEPDQAGEPGATLSYSHVLTNTGNGDDTFSVTVSSALEGWTFSLPQQITLARGLTATVELTLTVPASALAGTLNTFIVTARSASDPNASDAATNTATVLPRPGVTLLPPSQSGDGPAGDVVVYSLVVSNSGNITDSFTLTRTNTLTWTTLLTPTFVGPLAPGQALTVTFETTIPPGTPDDTLSVATITATSGLSPTTQATAQITTTAGRAFSLLFSKDESATVRPGEVVSYTHRLVNTGARTDSFVFEVTPGLNWPVRVFPDTVQDLGPGEGVTVTVRISVPRSTAATRQSSAPIFPPDETLVRVFSVSDPRSQGQVRNTTTVRQVAGLEFSPRNARSAQPGATLSLQHSLTNRGNGFDSFSFSARTQRGWQVTLSANETPNLAPAGIAGFASSPTFSLLVTVRVPTTAAPGDFETLTITATSRLDGRVFATVIDSVAVPLIQEEPQPPTTPRQVRLPLVLK
jgi:uncharacterized membrane protein